MARVPWPYANKHSIAAFMTTHNTRIDFDRVVAKVSTVEEVDM